jgi:hypothetical protein
MTHGAGRPERATPEHGRRYVLARSSQTADAVRYDGHIVAEDVQWPVSVEVQLRADTPDGLAVSVTSEVPEDQRQQQHRLAGAMVRAAVRRALKEGLVPPRRIQRWRDR